MDHWENAKKDTRKKIKELRNFNLKDQKFLFLKTAQLVCSSYIFILILMNLNGFRRAGMIENKWQTFCLIMSKLSAFAMYPLLVVVFTSKCRATLNFVNKTPLSLFIPEFCTDSHTCHSYAGRSIAYFSCVHAIFHILRWIDQGKMLLLVNSTTGLTGLFCIMVLPSITVLMMYTKIRAYFNYEIRKTFHYLYYIFALSLCFHVPISRFQGFLAPIIGTVLIWYTMDVIYVILFMTEKIHTPVFQVLESGVQITMTVSRSFQERLEQGGYVFICLPWVNREWHAFSLFEVADHDNQRQVFIQNVGNWTNELYQHLKRNTHRPLWIQGPFASPFHHAQNYDNQILVASGIGITPILSTARAYMSSRRVNMIWIVREPDVLEFYLEYLSINTDGWLIAFYTGRKPLSPLLEEYWSHTNVRIIKGRPDLKVLISGLIYGIESRVGLPETFYNDKKDRAINDILNIYKDVIDDGNKKNDDILETAFALARSHGFQLTALIQEMEKKNDKAYPGSRRHLSHRLSSALFTNIGNGEAISSASLHRNGKRYSDSLRDRDTISNDSLHGNGKRYSDSLRDSDQYSDGQFRRSSRDIIEVLKNYDETNNTAGLMRQMGRRPSNHFRPTDISYEPWMFNQLAPGYVKNLDKQVLDTWGLVFCGRNASISKILHNVTDEYNIKMMEERYEW